MNAEDLMRRDVVTVAVDDTLEQAARLMLAHGVNALPVLRDDGSVAGVVGIKDVLRAPAPSGNGTQLTRYQRLEQRAEVLPSTRVRDVMALPPITFAPDAPAADVAATLVNRGVHPIVVLDGRRLVGVIGRADVVAAIIGLMDSGRG